MQKYKEKRILRRKPFKLSILITKFQSLITPVILTGCMGVYEGGFECAPQKGVGCKSISEVNEIANQCSVSSMQFHGSIARGQDSECQIPAFSSQTGGKSSSSAPMDIWYSPRFIKDQMVQPHTWNKGSLSL